MKMTYLAACNDSLFKIFELGGDGSSSSVYDSSSFSDPSTHIADCQWYKNNNNGYNLFSVYGDGELAIIKKNKHEWIEQIIGGNGQNVVAVGCDHNGRTAALGTANGKFQIVRLGSAEILYTSTGFTQKISAMSFLSKDDYLCTGTENGEIFVLNCTMNYKLSERLVDQSSSQTIQAIDSSMVSRGLIGTASDDGCVRLWDVTTGRMVKCFRDVHGGAPCTGFSFFPINGMLAASCGFDRNVVLLDVLQPNVIKTIEMRSPLCSINLAAENNLFAAGTDSGDVIIYSLAASRIFSEIDVGTQAIKRVAFMNQEITPRKSSKKSSCSSARKSTRGDAVLVENEKKYLAPTSAPSVLTLTGSSQTYARDLSQTNLVPTSLDKLGCFSPLESNSIALGSSPAVTQASSGSSYTFATPTTWNRPTTVVRDAVADAESFLSSIPRMKSSVFSPIGEPMVDTMPSSITKRLEGDNLSSPSLNGVAFSQDTKTGLIDSNSHVSTVPRYQPTIRLPAGDSFSHAYQNGSRIDSNGQSSATSGISASTQTAPVAEKQSGQALGVQGDFIREIIDDAFFEFDLSWRTNLSSLTAVFIRQMDELENRMVQHQDQVTRRLAEDNARLRAENERLKAMQFGKFQ